MELDFWTGEPLYMGWLTNHESLETRVLQLQLDLMEKIQQWPDPVYDIAWHPAQHMIAVSSYGQGQQVLPRVL